MAALKDLLTKCRAVAHTPDARAVLEYFEAFKADRMEKMVTATGEETIRLQGFVQKMDEALKNINR